MTTTAPEPEVKIVDRPPKIKFAEADIKNLEGEAGKAFYKEKLGIGDEMHKLIETKCEKIGDLMRDLESTVVNYNQLIGKDSQQQPIGLVIHGFIAAGVGFDVELENPKENPIGHGVYSVYVMNPTINHGDQGTMAAFAKTQAQMNEQMLQQAMQNLQGQLEQEVPVNEMAGPSNPEG